MRFLQHDLSKVKIQSPKGGGNREIDEWSHGRFESVLYCVCAIITKVHKYSDISTLDLRLVGILKKG